MVDGNNKVTWLVNYTTLLNQRVTAELVAPSLGYKLVENTIYYSCRKEKFSKFMIKTLILQLELVTSGNRRIIR